MVQLLVFPAIIRPGLIYGPYGEAQVSNLKVLRHILEEMMKGNPVDLPDIGRDDEFNMSYVRDVASAIYTVHSASENQYLVYCTNVSESTSWGEIAGIIEECVPGPAITFGRSSSISSPQILPEEYRIISEFGFRPKYGINEGVRELIEWYQDGQP